METTQIEINREGKTASIPPATGSSRINVSTPERIASVIGGTALSVFAIRNFSKTGGKAMAIAAAMLLKRGATGYCEVNALMNRNTAQAKSASAIEAHGTFTIRKPREEVYSFWRKLDNLPRFMKHLESVEVLDQTRSTWKARIPGGIGTVTWEAVIQEEQQDTLLRWASQPGSTIDNAGEVRFTDAPRNEGTEVSARISYRLPAGDAGTLAGKIVNPIVEKMVREDLRRFKSLMETGEIPTSEMSASTAKAGIDSLVE